MKKIILISLLFITATSCSVDRILGIKPKGFTYKYDGKYTGLDTLINIKGYYESDFPIKYIEASPFKCSFMFYNNGLVACNSFKTPNYFC